MIKKIWRNLLKYFNGKNGAYTQRFSCIYRGLILGFILAIIVVQIKTLLDSAHKPVSSEKNLLKKSGCDRFFGLEFYIKIIKNKLY